jgi:hypothetical protein
MFNLSNLIRWHTCRGWPEAMSALALVVETIRTVSRHETSKHFKKEQWGRGGRYFKDKTNELEVKTKGKNIGDLCSGISEFKRGFQSRTNYIKDEDGDLFADCHIGFNTWKSYLSVTECTWALQCQADWNTYCWAIGMWVGLLRLGLPLKSWNGINQQTLVRFENNWFKEEIKHYIRRLATLFYS